MVSPKGLKLDLDKTHKTVGDGRQMDAARMRRTHSEWEKRQLQFPRAAAARARKERGKDLGNLGIIARSEVQKQAFRTRLKAPRNTSWFQTSSCYTLSSCFKSTCRCFWSIWRLAWRKPAVLLDTYIAFLVPRGVPLSHQKLGPFSRGPTVASQVVGDEAPSRFRHRLLDDAICAGRPVQAISKWLGAKMSPRVFVWFYKVLVGFYMVFRGFYI